MLVRLPVERSFFMDKNLIIKVEYKPFKDIVYFRKNDKLLAIPIEDLRNPTEHLIQIINRLIYTD